MAQSRFIPPADYRVLRILEEAKARHGNIQLTLKSIAKPLRTCGRHLGRLFKTSTGMVFRDYLRNVRMLEARSRLLQTTQSVQQIALELGYEVPANFSADFKRFFGCSPIMCRSSKAVASG